MIIFLTSSPTGDLDGGYTCEGFDNRNGFLDELRSVWPEHANVLMITAFPDDRPANEEMYEFFGNTLEASDLSFDEFELWDREVLEDEEAYSQETLREYDVIILGGGHVPTQNEFFHELHLKESLEGYEGIVIGISAGTMDCADVVYAQPEEPGEALDPDYERFLPGLGLTDINVLPHYQIIKDKELDGMSIIDEISRDDSFGNEFVLLPDGSYIIVFNGITRMPDGEYIEGGEPVICGEAYLMKDGEMTKLCEDGNRA